MKNLVFDIETIPSQRPGIREEFAAAVTAPAKYSKPDSIAEWLRENRDAEAEQAYLRTSFDGGLGQVCVIGFAVDDGPVHAYAVEDLSMAAEREVLEDFFSVLTDAGTVRLIGHNSNAFDIPFLWKRAMVLGVKPPFTFPRNPKPWSEMTFDTMVEWAGVKERISMEKLCSILSIPGKGGMDGSQVWPMVQAGKIAEVVAYCKGDVERTRVIFKRMTFATPAPALAVGAPPLSVNTASAELPADIFGA